MLRWKPRRHRGAPAQAKRVGASWAASSTPARRRAPPPSARCWKRPHTVSVHEFLGTLVYDSNGRSKVVHYWRMEAGLAPVRKLMRDVEAVDWLPPDRAVKRAVARP